MSEDFSIKDRTLKAYHGKETIVSVPEDIDRIDDFVFSKCENLKLLIIPNTLKSIGDFSLPLNADVIVNISCEYHKPQPIPLIGPIYLYLKDQIGVLKGVLSIPDHYQDEPHLQFIDRLSKGQVSHLSEYDELFYESEQIVIRKVNIALYRLRYPLELEDKYRKRYVDYLIKHAHLIVPRLIESSDASLLSVLAEIYALPLEAIDKYIDQASELPEIETRAILMNYKERIKDKVQPTSLDIEDPKKARSTWEYEENDDETLTITRYHGSEIEVKIPSSIDGRRVTRLEGSIGSLKVSIFHPNPSNVQSVIIEEGIEEIGKRAFLDCANLQSVTIPTSVKVLGEQAFAGCKQLKQIFPKTIPTIGDNAFSGIRELSIDYNRPPAALDRLGIEGLYINLQDDDQKTMAKLYIPRFETYEKDHPYLELMSSFSEGGINSLSEFDELFNNYFDLLEKDRVALGRLEYPYQLLEKDRKIYTEFLIENEHLIIPPLIRKGDLSAIEGLAALDVICREYLYLYIEEARDYSRAAIEEVLVRYQETNRSPQKTENSKLSITPEDWNIEEDDIVGYNGSQLIVIFPSTIKGQKIKRIRLTNSRTGNNIFPYADNVISVIVEEGIEVVGFIEEEGEYFDDSIGRVFLNCLNLKRVQLPSSIRGIHPNAFWGCEKVVIHAPKGSYAIEFAEQNGIKYVET